MVGNKNRNTFFYEKLETDTTRQPEICLFA
jgi:hypothetical protein